MQNGIFRITPALFALSLSPVFAADATFFATPRINGYEEVSTRSSPATGEFTATLNGDGTAINYELSYSGFTTTVREAHIHLGRFRVNGGVMVFLCSNVGTGPANTPLCPATGGTVTGTLVAASVVGPMDQGIAPGEFEEVLAALRARAGYVNIHTAQAPAGEVRNQVLPIADTGDATEENDTSFPTRP